MKMYCITGTVNSCLLRTCDWIAKEGDKGNDSVGEADVLEAQPYWPHLQGQVWKGHAQAWVEIARVILHNLIQSQRSVLTKVPEEVRHFHPYHAIVDWQFLSQNLHFDSIEKIGNFTSQCNMSFTSCRSINFQIEKAFPHSCIIVFSPTLSITAPGECVTIQRSWPFRTDRL